MSKHILLSFLRRSEYVFDLQGLRTVIWSLLNFLWSWFFFVEVVLIKSFAGKVHEWRVWSVRKYVCSSWRFVMLRLIPGKTQNLIFFFRKRSKWSKLTQIFIIFSQVFYDEFLLKNLISLFNVLLDFWLSLLTSTSDSWKFHLTDFFLWSLNVNNIFLLLLYFLA